MRGRHVDTLLDLAGRNRQCLSIWREEIGNRNRLVNLAGKHSNSKSKSTWTMTHDDAVDDDDAIPSQLTLSISPE
jgi:hypothetical protein